MVEEGALIHQQPKARPDEFYPSRLVYPCCDRAHPRAGMSWGGGQVLIDCCYCTRTVWGDDLDEAVSRWNEGKGRHSCR